MPNSSLTGKRILITRASQQLAETAKLVESYDAIPIALPCLKHQTLNKNIRDALKHIKHFDDIVFTSVNGVQAVFEGSTNANTKLFINKRIVAVGKKTAAALSKYGVSTDIIPELASQQGLIKAFQEHGLPQSLLFFRAEDGSDALLEYLQHKNIHCQLVPAYRTICPNDSNTEVRAMLKEHHIDAALLGSSKTTKHYLQRIGNLELANSPTLVAISQQVSDAADKLGLKVQIIAKHANFPSMLESLAEHYSQRSL